MVYEKDKIKKIILFKDNIQNQEDKENIEWLIKEYNYFYIYQKENKTKQKQKAIFLNEFYKMQEEKEEVEVKFNRFKIKYKILEKEYLELKKQYKICCKKL